jgi:hypothetical protein
MLNRSAGVTPEHVNWPPSCSPNRVHRLSKRYREIQKGPPVRTSLPERSQPDRLPSRREIAAICVGYSAVLVVFAGLIAYDVRVITWVSEAAQAEAASSNSPVAPRAGHCAASFRCDRKCLLRSSISGRETSDMRLFSTGSRPERFPLSSTGACARDRQPWSPGPLMPI